VNFGKVVKLKMDWTPGQHSSERRGALKQGILKGEDHCTLDLLFDWFGISCTTTDNFLFLFAKQTTPNQSNRRLTVQ
jgi:hypothetical protein